MCSFKSGIAVKINDEQIRMYALKGNDSHSMIRAEYLIRDCRNQVSVELVPVRGLMKIEDYDFVFDDDRPDWWTEKMTVYAKNKLFALAKREIKNKHFRYTRDLCLTVEHLPPGMTFDVNGALVFSKLTHLPENTTLNIDGSFSAPNLEALSKGVVLNISGSSTFPVLANLPKNIVLNVGGNLTFISLLSISGDTVLNVGGDLNLWSLESLSDKVVLNVDRNLNFWNLNRFSDSITLNVGGDISFPSWTNFATDRLYRIGCRNNVKFETDDRF